MNTIIVLCSFVVGSKYSGMHGNAPLEVHPSRVPRMYVIQMQNLLLFCDCGSARTHTGYYTGRQ